MSRRLAVRSLGTSLAFAQSTNRVVISSDFVTTGALTIAAWINARSLGGDSLGRIIANGTPFRFTVTATNKLQCTSNNSTNASSATDSIPFGKWLFVTLTRTSAGVVNFYVNGVLSGTANQSSGTPTATGAGTTCIGNNDPTNSRGFDGHIDSLRVFNRVLTVAEIGNLYYGVILPKDFSTSLLAEYLFNEGSGTNAYDSSGNGRHGTITGAAYSTNVPITTRTTTASRVATSSRIAVRNFGTAMLYGSGNTNEVFVENSAAEVHDNVSDLTISIWAKPAALKSNNFVFAIPATGGNNRRYIFGGITGNLSATVGSTAITGFTGLFTKDKWHHIALQVDWNGSRARLWLNGTAAAWTSFVQGTTVADVRIGYQGTSAQDFEGILDQCYLWNRVLSSTEVTNLYRHGLVPSLSLIGGWLFNEATGTTAFDSSGRGNNGVVNGPTYTTEVFCIGRTAV